MIAFSAAVPYNLKKNGMQAADSEAKKAQRHAVFAASFFHQSVNVANSNLQQSSEPSGQSLPLSWQSAEYVKRTFIYTIVSGVECPLLRNSDVAHDLAVPAKVLDALCRAAKAQS